MRPVRIRIDQIAIELGEEQRAGEAEETLRTALALLASRLSAAPFDLGKDAPARALQLLDVEPVGADWLAGPGAAARLADELYRRILRAAA